jgi:hypothetical protein
MPLVWAHAEYVKLRRSLHDGRVFDTPPQPVQRYLVERTGSPHMFWRFDQKRRSLSAGKVLRLEVLAPAVVHWSSDGWDTAHDARTRDTGVGVYLADLPTEKLAAGAAVVFTFYWPEAGHWEEQDFRVTVEESRAANTERTERKSSADGGSAQGHEQASETISRKGESNVRENGASSTHGSHKRRRHQSDAGRKTRSRQDEG